MISQLHSFRALVCLAIHWLTCLGIVLSLGQASAAGEVVPHWIWFEEEPSDQSDSQDVSAPATDRQVEFQQEFHLTVPAISATLQLAADFCEGTIFINSRPIVAFEPYSPTIQINVLEELKSGNNVVSVRTRGINGPAALAISLLVDEGKGVGKQLYTNENWNAQPVASATSLSAGKAGHQLAVRSWGPVSDSLWGIDRRSATIQPTDNYEQWRQAMSSTATGNSSTFWLAPGFDVTLVREAGADEGSWVSLAFDPQGSITIAREDRGLLGMTLSQDCTKVVEVKTLNETLAECRGLLYAYGYLFVSANNSKGLYRLRDSDGDRFFDEEQLLRNFPGGAGHGRNDLVLGPDGMIYVIHGDSVDIPTADVSDLTSPLREARRGGKTSEGHVVRTDRDGASWEVVCGGLRNPFGIAFNRHGDCFTYDADAEFDMGTPWYRPTRVVQLMPGADYGWRGVTGKWPPYDPDQPTSTPAILDIGKGSPTAVMFGEQLRFPEDYRNALFVLDWAYGRVMAVHLMPRGTTYRARAETFLQGRPLNVTDIATGPDGALYLITGGRKTQSALYRVTYKGVLPIAPGESASSDHEQRCAPFASTARQLRRSLELLGPELEFRSAEPESTEPDPVKLIADSLSSFDPWLRAAARTALEKQSAPFMAAVGGEVTSINGQLEYFLAGMRLRPQDFAASTIGYCLTLDDQDLSLGQAWTVAYLYAQCWQEAPESIRPQRSRVVSHVEYLFRQATSNRQVNAAATDRKVAYQCAELLVQLEAEHVVDVVSASLLRSASQEDRLQGLLVLRSQASGWTNALRREFFTALNDGESFLRGEGMPKFLSQIREEALRTFSEQERAELESILEAPRERSLPPLEPRRGAIVKQWRVSDFEQLLGDGEHVPDRQRGARIFQEALCDRCHQAGARGPAIGPDLTYVSRRFSRHDLLLSLLEPSAVVAENYRSVRILLQDGRVIVGRLLAEGDYRSEKLQIAVDWLRPLDVLEVDKKDIESIQESDESPMPASLLDSFQVEEILDLLYYLTSDI